MRALWAAVVLVACGCGGFREPINRPDGATAEAAGPKPFGHCCGKHADCLSSQCVGVGAGPLYCTRSCNAPPDDCPVGFRCSDGICAPPGEPYECGPKVAVIGPQGYLGCCGKDKDCLSGSCLAVGDRPYFCTQTCAITPDTCPVGSSCAPDPLLCVPDGAYACAWKQK